MLGGNMGKRGEGGAELKRSRNTSIRNGRGGSTKGDHWPNLRRKS